MATQTEYDSDKNQHDSLGADNLRAYEEELATSKAGQLGNRFNKQHEGQDKNTASPEALRGAEQKGVGGSSAGNAISGAAGITGEGGSNKRDMLMNGAGTFAGAKAKSFMDKHKKKLLIGGMAGIGIFPIIAFILFIIGLLSLPNYASNMAARQFVKVTRSLTKSTQNIMNEKNAISSLSDDDFTKAQSKYARLKSNTFGRLDRFRPNKVLQQLETSNAVQYNYEKTGRLGRERLVGITFSNDGGRTKETIKINQPGFFESRIHPVRTLQNRLDTTRKISAALNDALKVNDPRVPTVTRAQVVSKFMREKLGVSKRGLVAAKYAGKDTREARIIVQQDSYDTVKDKTGARSFTRDDLKETAQDINEAEDACVKDPKCVGKTVDNPNQVPAELEDVLDKKLNPERIPGWRKAADAATKLANPVYDIALPVCLIYDGSRLSPESVDSRSNEAQRTAGMVMATSDQQKQGTNINAETVGAMNWKLGDTNQSNAIKRNSGKEVNTLASTASTQATPMGGYAEVSIFNALLDGQSKATAAFLNKISGETCPTMTDPVFGVALGVGNVVLSGLLTVVSGGAFAVAEQGAINAGKAVATTLVKKAVTKTIDTIVTREGRKAALKYGFKEGVYLGGVVGATWLAKALVGMHAIEGSGLQTDTSYANAADNGANQLGNNMERVGLAGRPLTLAESTESRAADDDTIAQINSSKSTFERYLAFDNPNSLATRVGMTMSSGLNQNLAGSTIKNVSSIFNPLTIMPKLFGSFNNKVVLADQNIMNLEYGNVQFGWTKAEFDLIDRTPSYNSPSENEFQMDERSDREKIAEEYDDCFTETIGQLLADKKIVRDNETGEVLNEGLCSPKNLGPNNPTYGDGVFRLRLFNFYNGTLDTLEGIEKPAKSRVASAADTADNQGDSTGSAELSWPVAKTSGIAVSSCFGLRSRGDHKGIDISGPRGTDILAASNGKVTRSGPASGYGPHFVIIENSSGMSTSYGHMDSASVKAGDVVKAGQKIGVLGNLGESTGPHLHFNTFKGSYKGSDAANENPLKFLKVPSDVNNPKGCKG